MAGAYLIIILASICTPPFPVQTTIPAQMKSDILSGKPVIIEFIHKKDRGGARAAILVHSTVDKAWNVLVNVRKFPAFIPDLNKVEILEKGPGWEVVKFTASRAFINFSYITQRHYEQNNLLIWWEGRDNKFTRNEGYWKLLPQSDGVILIYYAWIKPRFPVPQFIINYLHGKSLPGLMKAVKKHIEGKGMGKERKEKPASVDEIPF